MTDSQIRQLAKTYAERFDVDNGDTLDEYAIRASYDVYSAHLQNYNHKRIDFRNLVKASVRELEKATR